MWHSLRSEELPANRRPERGRALCALQAAAHGLANAMIPNPTSQHEVLDQARARPQRAAPKFVLHLISMR